MTKNPKNQTMKKNVVAGLGEIGRPILKLLSKRNITIGFDLNPDSMDQRKFERYKDLETSFLHTAIPVTAKFINNILKLEKKFNPECIVIHSTIKPGTTKKLQERLSIPVIYSATRGVHRRMIYDLKRYTKFFTISKNAPRSKWASLEFVRSMKKCGIKTRKMSKPETLELAKIVCDTSYDEIKYFDVILAYSEPHTAVPVIATPDICDVVKTVDVNNELSFIISTIICGALTLEIFAPPVAPLIVILL